MAQKITKHVKDMVAAANEKIDTISCQEAMKLVGDDNVVFVDIRDVRELKRDGKIHGAYHAPRGMLEFWVDPLSPYHKEIFGEDKTFIFYCASAWRSALTTLTLQNMGLAPICHLEGGFTNWRDAGGPVEEV